jgi:CRP-like cAMP-binding protein
MYFPDSSAPSLSLRPLMEGRRLHLYDRGEEIPLDPDGIWQVYRGIAQLSQISDWGETVLLGWAMPSGFFGPWLSNSDTCQAKALSEVYLRWYPLKEIEASPQLAQGVLSQVVQRVHQTEALLAIAGLRRVEDRLVSLLKLLQIEMGQPTETGTRIAVRMTHQEFAHVISTTRVTITRLLGEWQRQGKISFDSDRHLVIHPHWLAG